MMRSLRERMGRGLFAWEDWSNHCKAFIQEKDDPGIVSVVPWSIEILDAPCPFSPGKKRKDTHELILELAKVGGEPLSLARFVRMHTLERLPRFVVGAEEWTLTQPFASNLASCRWHAMYRGIVKKPFMTRKEMRAQVLAEFPEYTIPNALTVAMLHMFHGYQFGCKPRQYLDPEQWMMTSDQIDENRVVEIGCSSPEGVYISHSKLDEEASDNDTGVALELKLPSA